MAPKYTFKPLPLYIPLLKLRPRPRCKDFYTLGGSSSTANLEYDIFGLLKRYISSYIALIMAPNYIPVIVFIIYKVSNDFRREWINLENFSFSVNSSMKAGKSSNININIETFWSHEEIFSFKTGLWRRLWITSNLCGE